MLLCAYCIEPIIVNSAYPSAHIVDNRVEKVAAWVHGFVDPDTSEGQDDDHEAVPHPATVEGR